MSPIEDEYRQAIDQAMYDEDNDAAADLATGLAEYRSTYRDE